MDPPFPFSQSPLIPFLFCQHRSASFENFFALSLDCKHFVSIAFLVLLVLVRFTLLFLCFSFRDVRAHLRDIHWDWSCGLCGSGSVRVCAHSWRDCTNFLCRMTHISHVYISTLSRLLQHVITNFGKGAVLRLQVHSIQDARGKDGRRDRDSTHKDQRTKTQPHPL